MTNVKPRDIYALAVQPVIVNKVMEINSNMQTFHMMILVIHDFVDLVGRVLLIIVGEFLTYCVLRFIHYSFAKSHLIINNETTHKTN